MEKKSGRIERVKYLEILADNLGKAGWSWGFISAMDCYGPRIFVADAHRNERRFIVRAAEKLTAFLELESVIREHATAL